MNRYTYRYTPTFGVVGEGTVSGYVVTITGRGAAR
jgi:hypothetical protein